MDLLVKDIEDLINYIDCKEKKLFKNKLTELKFNLYQLLCFYSRLNELPDKYKNKSDEIYNEVYKFQCKITSQSFNNIKKIDYSKLIADIKNIENYLFRQVDITEVDKLDNKYIFSFNDCIDIVKDFFNSFDNKYYNDILPFLNKNYISSYHLDNIGECVHDSFSNNIFINIDSNNKYSINHIIILVHELGHSIQFLNNKEHVKSSYSIYSEFPSRLFELQFLKYLKNYYEDIDIDILINLYLKNLMAYTYNFDYTINRSYIENNIETMYSGLVLFTYVIGELLAIYYSKLYDADKDKAKIEIHNIFKNIGKNENKIILNKDFYKLDFLKEEILDNQKKLENSNVRKF